MCGISTFPVYDDNDDNRFLLFNCVWFVPPLFSVYFRVSFTKLLLSVLLVLYRVAD
jgi:hypothetical protein